MLHLTLEDQLFLGQPKQVGTHSTVHDHLAVMFEDDGETGYFYALDMRQNAQPVVDYLHVYNVDNTRNHHEARKLEICWDESGYLALLLINGYPHAVFDFALWRSGAASLSVVVCSTGAVPRFLRRSAPGRGTPSQCDCCGHIVVE